MPDRTRMTALEIVAHAVGVPAIALAAMLYFLTTWVPDALCKRDLVCVALLLAWAGSCLVHIGRFSSQVRIVGALAMAVGLAGSLMVAAW